jgi:hypothetical protein
MASHVTASDGLLVPGVLHTWSSLTCRNGGNLCLGGVPISITLNQFIHLSVLFICTVY